MKLHHAYYLGIGVGLSMAYVAYTIHLGQKTVKTKLIEKLTEVATPQAPASVVEEWVEPPILIDDSAPQNDASPAIIYLLVSKSIMTEDGVIGVIAGTILEFVDLNRYKTADGQFITATDDEITTDIKKIPKTIHPKVTNDTKSTETTMNTAPINNQNTKSTSVPSIPVNSLNQGARDKTDAFGRDVNGKKKHFNLHGGH